MTGSSWESKRRNLSKVEVAATKGPQPYSRVKSSSAVTDDGKLFLFGGFDEEDNLDGNVYTLDVPTLTWSTHKHHVYREGHSALGIGGDDILVYGGISEDYTAAHASLIDNDLIIYNVGTHQWSAAPAVGPIPPQRSRHAACLSADGTKMFISGGQVHEDATPLDDLYCYDIATGQWDGPRHFICRFDHFITFHDNKIWAFGGLTKEMAHATEISYFDLITNTSGSIVIHNLPKFEGDHIYMPTMNESLLLDVVVPMWTFEKVEPCIGLYDLQSLRWQAVLTGTFRPLLGYRWRHTYVHKGNLYMIGYPLTIDTNDSSYDYKLSDIVQIDLSDLGISGSPANEETEGGVISDLAKLLFQEDFSDFKITGIEGDERPSINPTFIESTALEPPVGALNNGDTFVKSKPIPVHSIILLARWPHFRRIISSGMTETQTGTLFIPEPVEWIRALLEYLYTDHLTKTDMNTITGLLILSNVYDLPRLRSLCIHSIYSQGFKIKNVLKVWSRARFVGEQVMAHNASRFCFFNWGKVVKTKQFRSLTKNEIVALCQEVENDGIIVSSRANVAMHGVHDALALPTETDYQVFTPVDHTRRHQAYVLTPQLAAYEEEEEEESEEELLELSEGNTPTSRFTTPQGSIYLGNPQMGMNSLGERRDADDTDMEE